MDSRKRLGMRTCVKLYTHKLDDIQHVLYNVNNNYKGC